MQTFPRTAGLLIIFLACLLPPLQAKDLSSYAYVLEDGSLEVNRNKIWLYGIHIPPTDRTCRTYESPVVCGPRAILALDFKIGSFFVDCEKMWDREDGGIVALCKVHGEDLSAWMLQQGWAVALPDAPFEYQTLEKIARARGKGIWGKVIGPP